MIKNSRKSENKNGIGKGRINIDKMIRGQREIEKYQVLNLIEIKTEDDRIINLLKKQKNSIFCFAPVGLLFSSFKTIQLFIASNGLANVHVDKWKTVQDILYHRS